MHGDRKTQGTDGRHAAGHGADLPRDAPGLAAARIADAAIRPDPAAVGALLRQALAEGWPPARISADLIPQAARVLGERWCEDALTFVDVTVGTARLQAALRSCEGAVRDLPPGTPAIVLASCPQSQHSLGLHVLADDIGRRGLAVFVAHGLPAAEVAGRVIALAAGAVFLTGAAARDLDGLQRIVRAVRATSPDVPVVLGGHVLAAVPDAAGRIGADLGTSDIAQALAFCDLETRPTNVPLSRRGR